MIYCTQDKLKNLENIGNNIDSKHFNNYILFIIIFIFELIFIFQGIDVTDTGYCLVNQVSAFSFPVELNSLDPTELISVDPMIFLTDFIGGFWLSLIDKPSLLWARLGGVLVFALNAAIIFSILSNHFERKKVFIAVLVSTIFLTCWPGYYILDYYYIPAFLINIEFWIMNKVIMQRGENRFHNFLLGFMVIAIVLSRIPLFLIASIPIALFVYSLIKGVNLRIYRIKAIPFFLGILFAALFFGIIYWILGVWNGFFLYIFSQIFDSISGNTAYIDQTYTMYSLIRTYLFDYIYAAMGMIGLCILFYIIYLIKSRFGSICAWIYTLFITFGAIIFMLYQTAYIDIFCRLILKSAIGIIIIISLTYVTANTGFSKNKIVKFFLFAGIIVMVVTPAGSNIGIINSYNGMWLILPLAILCGFQLKTSTKKQLICSIFSTMNYVLVSLLIISLFFHSTNVYRDDLNRFNLNTEFSCPGLHGIYSTPDRVKAVDGIVAIIDEFSDKNDKLLLFNSIPLIYYLTETRPALGNPWPDLFPLDMIKSSMKRIENDGAYPKLFIYAKMHTGNTNWPNCNLSEAEIGGERLAYLKYELINKSNYSLLWENDLFAIYQQPGV